MALKTQASFTGGELDPSLHERTDLQKYRTSLATARNTNVGKTGRIISRAGRKHVAACKLSNRAVKIHVMSHNGSYLEWGHEYVREYRITTDTVVAERTHSYTEDDLDDLQFVDLDFYHVAILKRGEDPIVYQTLAAGGGINVNYLGVIPLAPTLDGITVNGTGYAVDYLITYVYAGEESAPLEATSASYLIPVSGDDPNEIVADLGFAAFSQFFSEMRVYRRPRGAGAYGYIGSSTAFVNNSGTLEGTFDDFGQAADYTQGPPSVNPTLLQRGFSSPENLQSKTGVIYQGRLLLSFGDKLEASRPGFPNNFYRDYPYDADSSLSLDTGSEYSEMLRLIESDGLVAFTSRGVSLHRGVMSPTNLALDKKGDWVIDDRVPPIAVPGGVLFVDIRTNVVRELKYSEELGKYIGEEQSIFSDHLFRGNRITSWAFENGDSPLLWVTFSDGTYASFTYIDNQNIRSWTRHDSGYGVDYVASITPGLDQYASGQPAFRDNKMIFITNKSGQRYIEYSLPRYVSQDTKDADAEWDKNESIAAMDAIVSWSHLINDELVDDSLTLTPVVSGEWDGNLTLACNDDAIFPDPGIGAVGTVFKYFDSDRAEYLLTIVSRNSDNSVVVEPNIEFPSSAATNPRLYECKSTFDGLDHLEGENVSVVADGYVIASPNNTVENYDTLTVSGGEVTISDEDLYAIVHIGRPVVHDIETLDIDTVEQRPVLIESKTLNKLYIKTLSRGFYVSNRFPSNDTLTGVDEQDLVPVEMSDVNTIDVDYSQENPIIGNRYDAAVLKRREITIPGDWNSQGRVCIRNVDPVHFEIYSIMPDVEDLRRLNREG